MSRDDEDTERRMRRAGSHWGDEERAAVGAQQRFATDSAIRRRKASRSHPHGVPVDVPTLPPVRLEITEPIDLLERDLSQSEVEIVRRSKRDSSDPAVYGDIVKLHEALYRERSENRDRDAQYEAVLRSPHEVAKQLNERLTAVEGTLKTTESTLKTAKWIARAAMAVLGTLIGALASGVLSKTEEHGGEKVRLEQFRHDIDRLDEELRDIRTALGRRSAIDIVTPDPQLHTATIGVIR